MIKKLGVTLSICFAIFFTVQNIYAEDLNVTTGLESVTTASFILEGDYNSIDFFVTNGHESVLFELMMEVITNSELTFDSTRTITGNQTPGTGIRFVALTKENGFHFDKAIVVGASGVFSIDINLKEGYNIVLAIITTPVEEGKNPFASIIRRLPVEIREILSERTRNVTNSSNNSNGLNYSNGNGSNFNNG